MPCMGLCNVPDESGDPAADSGGDPQQQDPDVGKWGLEALVALLLAGASPPLKERPPERGPYYDSE